MNFFEQAEQKIDLLDIETYPLAEYPYIPVEYDLAEKKIHRVITIGELIKNFGFDINLSHTVGDLKANYLLFDVRYLHDLGYKHIYYKDLAPGDTSIVYELRVGDS